MSSRADRKLVRDAGFEITADNLAFLGAGGLLIDGTDAPVQFLDWNGFPVEDVADLLRRQASALPGKDGNPNG